MKFLVDIDKTTPYVDTNGISWWGYKGAPDVLKLYKDLEGQESCGLKVIEVFEQEGVIKAYVECATDAILGFYLHTRINGVLNEDKQIESINYGSAKLESVVLCQDYAVEGLQGFRLVSEDCE